PKDCSALTTRSTQLSYPNSSLNPATLEDVPLNQGIHPQGYYNWTRIVELYNACTITKDTDRLIALAGIAKEVQAANGDEYCAGIWKQWLPQQLLWWSLSVLCDDDTLLQPLRPGAYVAPSWSWASTTGSIDNVWQPEFEDGNYPVTILDVRIDAIGDPMGQIRDGFLRVRGRLFPVIIRSSIELEEGRFTTTASLETLGSRIINNMDLAFDVEESILPDERLHCLLIYERRYLPQFKGIILKPTGLRRGQFRRVGRFDKFPTEAESESSDTNSLDAAISGSQEMSSSPALNKDYFDEEVAFNWSPPSMPDVDLKKPESWFEYESYDGIDDKGLHQYTIEII
ncbi:MAG: hypothetical protein Q9187_009279, partial [Circinaria calcarea]